MEPETVTRDQLEAVGHRLGLSNEQIGKAAETILTGSWATRLLDELVDILPPGQRDAMSAPRVTISSAPTLRWQAYASRTDDGRYRIEYDQGLVQFVYGISRSLTALFVWRGSKEDSDAADHVTLDEVAAWIAFELGWMSSIAGRPVSRPFKVTRNQLEQATDLAMGAERFVIAHELAHIRLGHVDGTSATVDLAREHEFEADGAGLAWLVNLAVAKPELGTDSLYAGIELFLESLDLLETFGWSIPSATHPPAVERLDRIRAMAETVVPIEIRNPAIQISRMLADLRPRILRRAPSNRLADGSTLADRTRRDVFSALLVRVAGAIDDQMLVGRLREVIEACPAPALAALRDASLGIQGGDHEADLEATVSRIGKLLDPDVFAAIKIV